MNAIHPLSRAALAADPEFQAPKLRSLIASMAEAAPEGGYHGPEDSTIPFLNDDDIQLVCRHRKEAVIDEMDYGPFVERIGSALYWPGAVIGCARDLLQKACLRAIWIDILTECDRQREDREAMEARS